MKAFQIKFDGAEAIVTVALEAEGKWYKKSLKASDAQELWQGLESLLAIEALPAGKKLEAAQYIDKAKERENIEQALPLWLAKGNSIKVLPRAGTKILIDEETREEILAELFAEEPMERAIV